MTTLITFAVFTFLPCLITLGLLCYYLPKYVELDEEEMIWEAEHTEEATSFTSSDMLSMVSGIGRSTRSSFILGIDSIQALSQELKDLGMGFQVTQGMVLVAAASKENNVVYTLGRNSISPNNFSYLQNDLFARVKEESTQVTKVEGRIALADTRISIPAPPNDDFIEELMSTILSPEPCLEETGSDFNTFFRPDYSDEEWEFNTLVDA
jgi:hypothetical protein